MADLVQDPPSNCGVDLAQPRQLLTAILLKFGDLWIQRFAGTDKI
jgi:hypothetical protein